MLHGGRRLFRSLVRGKDAPGDRPERPTGRIQNGVGVLSTARNQFKVRRKRCLAYLCQHKLGIDRAMPLFTFFSSSLRGRRARESWCSVINQLIPVL